MKLITDRTSIETDWTCGMKYWWYKCEGGTGIVPAKEPIYYRLGRRAHLDLAMLAEGQTLEAVANSHVADDLMPPVGADMGDKETYARQWGWDVAFSRWFWPLFSAEWDVVGVEQEMILDRDPLWIAFTADLILRHKVSQLLKV
ncbi:MAG: hypothetical protein E4G90_09040, partial [Gemmatimonadales bacterium]